MVIQIDGLRSAIMSWCGDRHRRGRRQHVLALASGATENAAVVKALLADLVERELRSIRPLFILDGARRSAEPCVTPSVTLR